MNNKNKKYWNKVTGANDKQGRELTLPRHTGTSSVVNCKSLGTNNEPRVASDTDKREAPRPRRTYPVPTAAPTAAAAAGVGTGGTASASGRTRTRPVTCGGIDGIRSPVPLRRRSCSCGDAQ